MSKTLEDLLARTVATSGGCREWRGSRGWDGSRGDYPRVRDGGRQILVHRLAWILSHPDESPPAVVRHLCNNPPCLAPEHLAAGTQFDNMQDCIRAGRFTPPGLSAKGIGNARAILTEDDVYEIRRLAGSGEAQNILAAEFGVSTSTINGIVQGRTWRHLED